MNARERHYGLDVGAADLRRLELLNQHYNFNSCALLESVGLRPGSRIADVGCGHGAMTAWMAERVGARGCVYAIDASADQIAVARRAVGGGASHVHFVCAPVESLPPDLPRFDYVYSRFLIMHLADPAMAVAKMASLLAEGGRLVLEVADIASLRFEPHEPVSELWKIWWKRVGAAIGASYEVHVHAREHILRAGLWIEREDRFQPVSYRREAKLLHALGFEQMANAYIERAGAAPAEVEAHADYLRRVVDDENVRVALYETTQYVAVKTR